MEDEFDKSPTPPAVTAIKNGEITRGDRNRFAADIDILLRDAEALRLSYMKRHRSHETTALVLGFTFTLIGAAGFGWFLLVEADMPRAVGSITLAILLPLFFNLRAGSALKNYRHDYKTKFLPQMAKALGGFQFHPSRGISRAIIAKTGIVPAHDTYQSEDCFMGIYKGVKVIFSEAQLHVKKRPDPVFDGIFVLLETPQAFIEGHTILTSDDAMFKKWRSTRWVKLHDVAISTGTAEWDRFHVVSDQPELAKLLVGPGLLKELFEAGDIFDHAPISAALFRGKYIFMMIPYARDMFEPSSIQVPVATRQHALQCKREIEQILEVVDVFELYQTQKAASGA